MPSFANIMRSSLVDLLPFSTGLISRLDMGSVALAQTAINLSGGSRLDLITKEEFMATTHKSRSKVPSFHASCTRTSQPPDNRGPESRAKIETSI